VEQGELVVVERAATGDQEPAAFDRRGRVRVGPVAPRARGDDGAVADHRAGVRAERRDGGGEAGVEPGGLVLGGRDGVDDRAKGVRAGDAAMGR
jgi:hypothetical protein